MRTPVFVPLTGMRTPTAAPSQACSHTKVKAKAYITTQHAEAQASVSSVFCLTSGPAQSL